MLIGHYMPAYRDAVSYRAARTAMLSMGWCLRNGHDWDDVSQDKQPIDVSRNNAVEIARQRNHDLLLMQDDDVYVDPDVGPVIYRLRQTMVDHDAAIVAAAVVCRGPDDNGNSRPNCSPVKIGEAYDATTIGTGLVLLDMHKLSDLPLPWFAFALNDERTIVEVSEDVYFSRYALSRGYRVMIDWTFQTFHKAATELSNLPREATCDSQ